jgi:hypothetical protein
MSDAPRRRRRLAIELGVCFVLVALLSLNALRRMDYLDPDTRSHIRVSDASRTAYVAKNIAEGRGYTTNDLPAALVDFYDVRGKLHDPEWVNADRFPFGAYATAALYKVTGSTSWVIGILVYNTLFFVAFLVLLFHVARSIWGDRYTALFAVAIPLLHPYTYMYLYWKDGDMLFLSTACIALFLRYFREPPGTMSRRFAIGFGTVLAFVFLSRPNQGAPILLALGASILHRLWISRREHGLAGALKLHLQRELLIPLTVFLWCLPFMIHSMSEWGSPLFSANNLYQLPLGTRYGMGTDTWWKYTEPGQLPTLGLLAERAGDELIAKFTTSWVATIQHLVESHALELVLVGGLAVWYGRRAPDPGARPIRRVSAVIAFAVVVNMLLLPLYAFQSYAFRHYIAFGFPLVWIASGRAIAVLGEELRPAAAAAREHVTRHAKWYLFFALAAVLAWNLGASSQPDGYRLFARTSRFFGQHWMGISILCVIVLGRRWWIRPPWFPRVTAALCLLVFIYYRPNTVVKQWHFMFQVLDERVWDTLRERQGVVSSFALQGEVAWMTGRKNVPAPELPMHVYSFLFDHRLEIEDLYIESAQTLVGGPFSGGAPGFEGYERLQQYRALPGYEVAFHHEAVRGYPKFRVKPLLKASTVFRLVDRQAVQRIGRSPDRIALGDPANVIYTPHGWGEYLSIDGKRVATATNVTQARYSPKAPGGWEDASITFFIDQRRPSAVELSFYAPHQTTYTFYWNLDLYAYDRPKDRPAHQIGAYTVATPGWQQVRLEVPPAVLKQGLNKLGFRRAAWAPTVLCPEPLSFESCLGSFAQNVQEEEFQGLSPHVVRASGVTEMRYPIVAMFAHELRFFY